MSNKFIELSDEEYDFDSIDDIEDNIVDNLDDTVNGDNDYETCNITLIERKNHGSKDKKIKKFIDFCIDKKLFDDTFYDYNNIFSVIATKLPDIFNEISKDEEIIMRNNFTKVFKNTYGYKGDLDYVFTKMEEISSIATKDVVTWKSFIDFFVPYVRYITV